MYHQYCGRNCLLRSNCCILPTGGSGGSQMLVERHASLLFSGKAAKVAKQGMSGKLSKVVNVPNIFFTDDTSGGTSKQHISYESCSMTYTALPLENRGHRENFKVAVQIVIPISNIMYHCW